MPSCDASGVEASPPRADPSIAGSGGSSGPPTAAPSALAVDQPRILAALEEALQGLVSDRIVASHAATQILHEGRQQLRRELDRADDVQRMSGQIDWYRNCRGQWTLMLDRVELIHGRPAKRIRIGRMQLAGAEAGVP